MVPRIAIANYADAVEIYEALVQAHSDVTIQGSTALFQADIDKCHNRADHLQGLMALVADEVLRISNVPADEIPAHPDRASAEDMASDDTPCRWCGDDFYCPSHDVRASAEDMATDARVDARVVAHICDGVVTFLTPDGH